MSAPRFQLFINGEFTDAADTFAGVNPADGKTWAQMPAANAEDTAAAVAAASAAFNGGEWRDMNASARGKLLWRLADLLAQNAPELAALETRDTGKVIRETAAQCAYAAEYYRYFAGLADKSEGRHLPIDKAQMEVFTRREPLGVVAAIVPWNSQLFLAALKIAPALAAGNTVVVKASEDAPAPLLHFAKMISEAGFPRGVINIITGFGEECGGALCGDPRIARIAFTGGAQTARRVIKASAANLAPVTLELGGKSPVIVFDDANLESAANAVIAGVFAAAGQSCVAGSRLFVHQKIRDELIARITARLRDVVVGDPAAQKTDIGPLATARQRDRVLKMFADKKSADVKIITGGHRPDNLPEELKDGFYFAPTIIEAPADSPLAAEELFAPVLAVFSFAAEDEAIAKANATPYGLAAGVFTGDLARAHRAAKNLRAGIVWINTYRAVSPIAPIGGFGESGCSREGGADAINDYSREKAVWINTSDAPIGDPFIIR